MKRLNIFKVTNKKTSNQADFSGDSSISSDANLPTSGDGTILRIVSKKEVEKMKWQKEQEDFFRRKREHDLQLVKIEKQEIQKRDQKMKQKRKDLEEKRQKNLMIQDDITIQIKTLHQTLDQYVLEHEQEERDMEDEIIVLQERLATVKGDLEARIRFLDESLEEESIYQTETVKMSSSSYLPPSAPNIAGESFVYHPPPYESRRRHRSTSSENKSYISDKSCEAKIITPIERNANRRSLHVDVMRSAPRYFPPKQ